MKTKLLLVLVLTSATAYAAQRTSWGVQRVLANAIAGERAAIARYEAFAEKADAEGYRGVADLFRAAAKAERIHLARFTALMGERDLPLPPDGTRPVVAGSTRANLDTAAIAEVGERDDVYLDAYRACRKDSDEVVARVFDETRDVETEHANLCIQAARDLDEMKSSKSYFVCSHCGYTTALHLSYCPLCRQPAR